jgi:hypothetical protein
MSSEYNIHGSFTRDLVFSKFWLCEVLSNIKQEFSNIYILGSWYGNFGLIVSTYNPITFEKLINVDINKKLLKPSKMLSKSFNLKNVEYMNKDANDLDYRQLDKNGLVVNLSCNNIENRGWFENIPSGTLVVLQGRNNDPKSLNHFENLTDFINSFPLRKTLFRGKFKLQDPETKYHRYMIIGIK